MFRAGKATTAPFSTYAWLRSVHSSRGGVRCAIAALAVAVSSVDLLSTDVLSPATSAGTFHTVSTAAPPVKMGPVKMGPLPYTATNWGGYAAESNFSSPVSNSVTAVSGSWIVPPVTATANSNGQYADFGYGWESTGSTTTRWSKWARSPTWSAGWPTTTHGSRCIPIRCSPISIFRPATRSRPACSTAYPAMRVSFSCCSRTTPAGEALRFIGRILRP